MPFARLILLITLLQCISRQSRSFVIVRQDNRIHNNANRDKSPSCKVSSVIRPIKILLKAAEGQDEEEEEWHPRDPAETTPQLLSGLWFQIAQAGGMSKGESVTVLYPSMEEQLNQQPPKLLGSLLAHLDYCKDVCDHFGITTTLAPHKDSKSGKIIGFTAKSFRNPKSFDNGDSDGDDDEYKFDYDPIWDDGTDFDNLYKGVDDEDLAKDPYPEIVNRVPDDDEKIIDTTKQWVQRLMSDLGICPFSPSATQAGLPIGPVFYEVSRASTVEDMYAKYWEEVVRVEQQSEKDLSTTLLVTPEFFMDNVELFESFCNTLTQPLTTLNVEDLLQLVFFHPHWSFRDGGDRATQGQAANYARRSPWPMINILRTKQVRAAQKGIPTGLVYKQNEKTLDQVGVHDLETMLRLRDWTGLDDKKVNRKEVDALKIAQDVQETGQAQANDRNLANDKTPVANRVVDKKQVEEGDLVTVMCQALEKRLGKSENSTGPVALTGPEMSVTSMASEYLLQALDEIVRNDADSTETTQSPAPGVPTAKEEESASLPTPVAEAPSETTDDDDSENSWAPKEMDAARKAKMDAARKALLADLYGDEEEEVSSDRGDEMTDVYFGKGGVDARNDDDLDKDAFDSFQNF